MKEKIINEVLQQMLSCLDNMQLQKLKQSMEHVLFDCDISRKDKNPEDDSLVLIESFLSAKRIEGCSEKTIKYYKSTIEIMHSTISKGVRHIQTEDLRNYLTNYQQKNNSSKVTIDNIRRILSSFFSWLEDEDYIIKSPVRRIHKVKTTTNVKDTYSDEELENMRDACE